MHKEIIVNANPYEVRIAILEDKELVELLIERAENKRMVGDIYKGVVTAVLPGIQAAFVDIGTEKAAFLHVSDLLEVRDEVDDEPGDRRRAAHGHSRAPLPPIQDILQKGQELLVQVTKEPIATKGPRITSQISLPGRFAVIMPDVDHVGVSRKIEDRAERQRLKEIVTALKPPDCALIVRTVGEGASRAALELDVQHLVSVWREVQSKATPAPAPSLVHQDVGIVIGLVRDVFNEEVDQLVLDDRGAYDELKGYLRGFAPELADRVKLHDEPVPIFDKYGIESELDKTLDRKVWLKKGGYILIDQTEALVAIDVNTGRFTGKKNQEETILKTNLLAAREVARQLRLRDIGGIIVIDFIDMESEANKKKVLQDLRTWLKHDRAKTKAFQVSDLGLVEMSRQRVRPSLYHFMSDKCAYCESTGHVLSLDSVANRIERMVRRVSHYTRARDVRLQVNPQLAVFLREDRHDRLQTLARVTGVGIDVVDDARLHREDFRLISVQNGEDLMRRVSGPGLGNGQNGGGDDRDSEMRRHERRPTATAGRRPEGSRGGRDMREGRPREGRDSDELRAARPGREPGREPSREPSREPGRESARGPGRESGRESGRVGRGGGRGMPPRDGFDRGRPPRRSRDVDPNRPEPTPRLVQPAPVRASTPVVSAADGDAAGDPTRRRRRRGSRGRGRRGGTGGGSGSGGRPILENNHDLGARVASAGGTATAADTQPPEGP